LNPDQKISALKSTVSYASQITPTPPNFCEKYNLLYEDNHQENCCLYKDNYLELVLYL
jgi:hypothetical protein